MKATDVTAAADNLRAMLGKDVFTSTEHDYKGHRGVGLGFALFDAMRTIARAYQSLGERQPDTFAVVDDEWTWHNRFETQRGAESFAAQQRAEHPHIRVVRVATFVQQVEDGE